MIAKEPTPRQLEYQEYLNSEHWDKLRTAVLERDEYRCRKCQTSYRLEAHHVFYRENWEDAQPKDYITLCRSCHEEHHQQKVSETAPKPVALVAPTALVVPVIPPQLPPPPLRISNIAELIAARERKLITRDEFKRRRHWLIHGSPMPQRSKKSRNGKKRRKNNVWADLASKTRGLNLYKTHRWVNRGNSSN
jgi:hypothetical protein